MRARVGAPRSIAPPRGRRARGRLLLACLAVSIAWTAPASGQTLIGQVLDEVNNAPVAGASVSLVTRDGTARAQTLSDATGRFVLTPPEPGEYFIVVTGFGYVDTQSPLLALVTDGAAEIDLMVAPEPIGLEGIEISVEELAAEELNSFGLSPNQLGNRWIDRRKIDAIPVKRDMGSIIERTTVAGTRILRPANLSPGSDNMGLCVSLARGRTGAGQGTCALIILNGVPIGGVQALDVDPETIESMAVLEPTEATTYYGTQGGGGAVLVWTRRGG